MTASPFHLDRARRKVVSAAIQETCAIRGWWLSAAHIRSTHVHVVIATEDKPERVLIDIKSHASRALVKSGLETSDRPKWSEHGSTRWLWEEDEVHRGPEPWK